MKTVYYAVVQKFEVPDSAEYIGNRIAGVDSSKLFFSYILIVDKLHAVNPELTILTSCEVVTEVT